VKFFVWLLLPVALLGVVQNATADPPQRIASLNLCTDSMLFELVDDERIASVTLLARDPNVSYFHARAARLHANQGAVEQILATEPDLVITDSNLAPLTTHLLRRLGVPLLEFDHANDFDTYAANLTRLAAAIGSTARAAVILADMAQALAQTQYGALAHDAPRAVIYQPNGYIPGTATLMHEILERAGLRDIAAELGLTHGGFVSLERLLVSAPAVLVFSARQSTAPSLGEQLLHHPALQTSERQHVAAHVEENLWTCAGRFNLAAIRELAVFAR